MTRFHGLAQSREPTRLRVTTDETATECWFQTPGMKVRVICRVGCTSTKSFVVRSVARSFVCSLARSLDGTSPKWTTRGEAPMKFNQRHAIAPRPHDLRERVDAYIYIYIYRGRTIAKCTLSPILFHDRAKYRLIVLLSAAGTNFARARISVPPVSQALRAPWDINDIRRAAGRGDSLLFHRETRNRRN